MFCIGKNYIDHIAEVAKATTATVGEDTVVLRLASHDFV